MVMTPAVPHYCLWMTYWQWLLTCFMKPAMLDSYWQTQRLCLRGDCEVQMLIPEELDKQAAFVAAIHDRTDPARQLSSEPESMRIAPAIATVRGKLNLAKAYLAEVINLFFVTERCTLRNIDLVCERPLSRRRENGKAAVLRKGLGLYRAWPALRESHKLGPAMCCYQVWHR